MIFAWSFWEKMVFRAVSDTEHGEWKIQLVMQNNCISTKSFEETRTVQQVNQKKF